LCGEGFLVFSPYSQCVPHGTSILWIWFAQNSTPTYINWNLGEHISLYFETRIRRNASIGGMPNVPKITIDGPINMTPWKYMYLWMHLQTN
jgi:hypothetical protein